MLTVATSSMKPAAFHSYKQTSVAEVWDAIVIGSGIGGLSAAALLSRHSGKRVLVLERHYTAGGYTHSFHRPGYEWDPGVHYIGQAGDAASPERAAFDHITDGSLSWARMPDVYDRAFISGKPFDFVAGKGPLRESLIERFPREAKGIDGIFGAIDTCIRRASGYYAEKALPAPLAAVLGGMVRMPYLRWSSRTTAEVLREYTSNRELIGTLTAQWGDYGLPPAQSSFAAHATIASHYFGGGYYPVGGAHRIAEAIVPGIEENGGRVLISADVERIVLEGGRAAGVRMADGREFRAPVVISNAGASNTFERLLPAGTPAVASIAQAIRALPPSMSYITLYIGALGTSAELGIEGTNLWIHPSADHDANLACFLEDPHSPFPLVFLSFPSAKDPEFEARHPGHSTIEAVAPVPYRLFSRWEDSRWKHRGEDYEQFKSLLAERLRTIAEQHVPGLRGRIEIAELSTPLSARHFMNYPSGEAYGIAATPARFRLRALRPRTPVPGVFLTGQDVAMLGVTGALFGGGLCASAVLGTNIVGRMTRRK